MASFMKSMDGGMEKVKKLAALAKDFTGNAKDLVEKCQKVSTNLATLVGTVSEMSSSQSGNASELRQSVSAFSESITDLKREIQEDLQGNLTEAKSLVGDDGNKGGKPGKAEEMVNKITTVIEASLKLTDKFVECNQELEKVIGAVEENKWDAIPESATEMKGHLEEVKDNIVEIKNAITGDDNEKNESKSKDKVITKEPKKDDTPKAKSGGGGAAKPKKAEKEESGGCFSCCCCCSSE